MPNDTSQSRAAPRLSLPRIRKAAGIVKVRFVIVDPRTRPCWVRWKFCDHWIGTGPGARTSIDSCTRVTHRAWACGSAICNPITLIR
jgi:hypothetical protein